MRKRLLSLLTIACLLFLSVVPANATTYSSYRYSDPATASIWNTEDVLDLVYSSSNISIKGEKMGAYFYYNNVGLQSSFVQTTDRYAFFQIYEDDFINPDVFVRSYQASFSLHNGYYRPTTFIITETSSSDVEADGKAELYMKFFIYSMPGDTSTAVPAGLLYYRYWAN